MSGEQFLLSGDQLATFSGWSDSYPPPSYDAQLDFNDVATLGSAEERFFLVRTGGDGETISNPDRFSVYAAVDDGSGGLMPASSPLYTQSLATPEAFDGAASGDDYIVLGMYGGDSIIVNLAGFEGEQSFQARENSALPDGDGQLQLSEISAGNPDLVVCFVEGAKIMRAGGECLVQELRVGDRVLTVDHGFKEVLWISSAEKTLEANRRDRAPVTLKRGCLGRNTPSEDVSVSPNHRILISGSIPELLFGEQEVFVAAKHLVNGETIVHDAVTTATSVSYWHLLMDGHELVFSSGLRSESFHPGVVGMSTLTRAARAEVFDLFPELATRQSQIAKPLARVELKAHEARLLSLQLDATRIAS
jgi:hypothetical protein